MFRLARTAARPLAAARPLGKLPAMTGSVRNLVGIKIMDEAGKAQENWYWAQEDEKLLKKMIENHPELDPQYQGISGILSDESGSFESKVKMVFMKHGIP